MISINDLAEKFYKLTGSKEIKPAVLLMCADHGIAKHGVSAFPQDVTLKMMGGYQEGTAAANIMAAHAGADVFIVDAGTVFDTDNLTAVRQMKVARGTKDFTVGPAMSDREVRAAMAAGMQVVKELADKGYNLFITGEMAIGNTTSTAALISAMLGLSAEQTVGRGSGINDARLAVKRQVVEKGLAVNKPEQQNGLDCLKKLGGFEHAALAGAMLGAAEHHLPTVVDGVNATAAALCACGMDKKVTEYLFASHLSAEPGQMAALKAMGLTPVLDAGMHLGEGTGACLLVPLLRMALKEAE